MGNSKRNKQNDDNESIQEEFDETLPEYDEIDFRRLDEMTEDEAIIELDKIIGDNDSIVEKDYLSALLEQEDRLVFYEVENIYENARNKTYKNRLKLKKDPPILSIKDDYDNEAIFYLTENLTDELIDTLEQVKRAYHGFSGPSKMDMPDKFIDKIGYYAKHKPVKFILSIIVISAMIYLALK